MKSDKNKKNMLSLLGQFACSIVTIIICFSIYRWWNDDVTVCFALILGTSAFLLLCFYNIIFKGISEGMIVYVSCGVLILIFANKLYDYNQIKKLIPVLNEVDPALFSMIVLGAMVFILLFVKVLMYMYNSTETNIDQDKNEPDRIILTRKENNENITTVRHNKVEIILYTLGVVGITVVCCVIFGVFYKNSIWKQEDDFFQVVEALLKYSGYVLMHLLAFVVVIIFLIEMIRLVVSRIRSFYYSLKSETGVDSIPMYALSIVVDLIVCYLAYKFTGFTVDKFYDLVSSSEYLILPLIILFLGIAFIVFLRLTHATLLLLADTKPEDIKGFLKKINDKIEILDRVNEILKMLVDIVLDSIIVILKFVVFIPDFFGTIYSFVLEDEEESEAEDESVVEGQRDTEE